MSKIREDLAKHYWAEEFPTKMQQWHYPFEEMKGNYIDRVDAVCNLIASSLPEMSEEEISAIAHKELDYVHTTPHSQEILEEFIKDNLLLFKVIVKAYQDKLKKELEGD